MIKGSSASVPKFEEREFCEMRWFDFTQLPMENVEPHLARFVNKLTSLRSRVTPSAVTPANAGPSFKRYECSDVINLIVQIIPVRIHVFDDPDLPIALPFLELFLTADRIFHGVVVFIPNQMINIVVCCEAIKKFGFVF